MIRSIGFWSTLAGRASQAVLVAVVVGIVSFSMMQALPGDDAYRIAAGRYGYDMMDAASAEAVREELGLDQPQFVQLMTWLGSLAQLDLGTSSVSGTPIIEELKVQLGYSLLLAGAGIIASLLIAIPVGVASGLRPGGIVDRISLGASIILRAVPAFALGIFLMLALAVHLKLLPVAGFQSPKYLILPALTLGFGLAAVSSRVVRDAVCEAMSAEWRFFSRTKGLSSWQTLRRHVLRNASLPVVAYVGVQLAYVIEGVVIVESVFAFPGIGHALVHAIFGRDVPMVQGTALTLGLLYVFLNLIIDLCCHGIDPRRRNSV
ncbi:ABC transporter permease [Marinomonas sp. 2405UD68-3]|uniref:ABC transporter permease n=1 Tax=Marinomonas sp. 2405UD68-3 TaxID=3391835 RepID=UPI0039C99108